ncbi:MAG: GYD domain-containing protein [candidate division WOR-3 bacterium]|nr:GYD domain-containing protein [candidate division WOR-3 bacterium]MCX7836865.1 GYD domain-containing protein [candidate division WOR-3 bacterium]MDW8114329.1 GYD domain-containing protein [candidate division WOR-3 bacterium]
MAYYVLLTKLTDEGRKTLKDYPERLKEVNEEVEEMGAKIIAQYAILGDYDFINILEAPDNETIAKISTELGARGTIQITTYVAIPIDEFLKAIKK